MRAPCSSPPRYMGNGSDSAANLRASILRGPAPGTPDESADRGGGVRRSALMDYERKPQGSASVPSGMPSNSAVERYRSPVSGSIARITDPAGASSATLRAAANVPPEEMPQKMPSRWA